MANSARWFGSIVVAGLLLTGCTADDRPPAGGPEPSSGPTPNPSTSSSPTTPPVPTKVRTPTAAPTPTGPVRLTKSMTRPGARLRFGQQAVVPIRLYNSFGGGYDEGVIGITVGPIQRTAATNIEGNFDAKSRALLRGRTAYYARVVITNLGGTDLSLPSFTFDAYRSGRRNPPIALIGGELPEQCPDGPSPESFRRRGGRWLSCALAVSSAASPIRSIEYDGPPYGPELQVFPDDPAPRFNSFYSLGPISWH